MRTQRWETADEIPLKIKLVTPNGREYRTWRKTTNAQGAVETEVTVEASALTGTYQLEVYNANDLLLASQAVSVEEFMPDRIKVDLSGASTSGLPIENVVVTDLLPAGFEIENPRLTEPRDMPWIKNAATPDYFDIRDDRIHFFTTATAREQIFYYQVRVISKGTFIVGPVGADAMYQGEYRSYSGGGKVTVE